MHAKRYEALQHYSPTDPPQCACPGCGETNPALLEFDHEHSGNLHRRLLKHRHLEDVLAAQDYPPYVVIEGTLCAITILCHACNQSKGSGSSCCLTHSALMSHKNTEDFQEDMSDHETAQETIKRRSSELRQKVSQPTSGHPQVRMRIEPKTWEKIEAEAAKQKMAPGDFVKEMWERTIDQQFREVKEQLQVLKLQQDKMLSQLSTMMSARIPRTGGDETHKLGSSEATVISPSGQVYPARFAHRFATAPDPVPQPEPVIERSRWQAFWGWVLAR